jgi:hypothetical protein
MRRFALAPRGMCLVENERAWTTIEVAHLNKHGCKIIRPCRGLTILFLSSRDDGRLTAAMHPGKNVVSSFKRTEALSKRGKQTEHLSNQRRRTKDVPP